MTSVPHGVSSLERQVRFMPPRLDNQRACYGTYPDDVDAAVLAKFFHLDDADRILIRRHNGSHQRLGFALQLM